MTLLIDLLTAATVATVVTLLLSRNGAAGLSKDRPARAKGEAPRLLWRMFVQLMRRVFRT